jgi:hypothetical protein
MEAQATTKKPRSRTVKLAAADAAPEKDTRTGDLLAGMVQQPPFDVALAGPVGAMLTAPKTPAARAIEALNSSVRELELAALVKKSADIVEVKNKDGREQVHRMAMELKNARCGVEREGKTARDDANAFSKAVIAEEKRLVAITTAEEERLFKLRDDFDNEQARIKAEEERKEAERVGAIKSKIAVYAELPTKLAAADSATLTAKLEELAALDPGTDEYAEFAGEAALTIDTVGAALAELLQAAVAREEEKRRQLEEQEAERARLAAAEAEAARLREEQQRQNKAMAEIAAIQNIAKSDGSANELQILLGEVQKQQLDPAMFGQMLGVATMARDMAITSLQTKIATKQAEEEAFHRAATEKNGEPINAHGQRYSTTTFKDNGEPILLNADGSRSIFCDIADDCEDAAQPEAQPAAPAADLIDWDAPMTARPYAIMGAFSDAEPQVEESPAVQAFLVAVRELRKTYSDEAICELLANELEGVAA